jgi:hypothetical protein
MHGVAMGSPISGSIAEILLQYRVTIKEIDTFNVVLKRNYSSFSQNTYMGL